jgi:prevent-host-death family protein
MGKTVNVHAAKTHLSRLLDEAAAGEEIVIAKAGIPVARLVPFEAKPKKRSGFGAGKGTGWISDDFDAPLPDDILRAFGGDPANQREARRRLETRAAERRLRGRRR